jgi:uncharacterized repeat protein (TIGR03803 family)
MKHCKSIRHLMELLIGLGVILIPSAQAANYTQLYSFKGDQYSDGKYPYAPLVLFGGNTLRGTTEQGGKGNLSGGTVFDVPICQSGHCREVQLHSFPKNHQNDGDYPRAGLYYDAARTAFYGTTTGGGQFGWGDVFEMSHAFTEKQLYSFRGVGHDGATPYAGLISDAKGQNLYGTTSGAGLNGFGTIFVVNTGNGRERTLYNFTNAGGDGANPLSGLTLDATGQNLYGTTRNGGFFGFGTVFQLNLATGVETVLYSFAGNANGDGANPVAGLVEDGAGNFYGTTVYGGTGGCNDGQGDLGCGTVFALNRTVGAYAVLYSFSGGADGKYPICSGSLVWHSGNLYGTTFAGGNGWGTVFVVNASTGMENPLYPFGARPDGTNPYAGLTANSGSVIYLFGTTLYGGAGPCNDGQGDIGCGTVFRLGPF